MEPVVFASEEPAWLSDRATALLARFDAEEEAEERRRATLQPIATVPITYPPPCQRHREMVRDVVSHCCEALVFRQVYQRSRMMPTATSGPGALLKPTMMTEWFYECSSCEERCNVNLSVQRAPVPQAFVYGTSSYLFQFLDWYRKQPFCAILPATVVDSESLHRYNQLVSGDACVSVRTDQKRCPIRTHERNSLVLRFNLTRREFSVCCWCSPRPFDTRELSIIDTQERLRLMDAEIQEWYKD